MTEKRSNKYEIASPQQEKRQETNDVYSRTLYACCQKHSLKNTQSSGQHRVNCAVFSGSTPNVPCGMYIRSSYNYCMWHYMRSSSISSYVQLARNWLTIKTKYCIKILEA
jgi:hypothetical protein